jgi:hypothetical protein
MTLTTVPSTTAPTSLMEAIVPPGAFCQNRDEMAVRAFSETEELDELV